ncbi:MAG: S1 family peptidase, partial [Spirochaeta sp.]
MLEAVSQRFQGSCMMIMRRDGDEVTFLGSGFLIHPDGYLLTTSHIVAVESEIVVLPPDSSQLFRPVTLHKVAPVPADVVSRDSTRDIALLKLRPQLDINMPTEVLGSSESDARGAQLISLGVPFGYYRFHGVMAAQSILSGRIESRTGVNLIIFNRRVQYGDIGGPLISGTDGRVIGIVGGVFDPIQ